MKKGKLRLMNNRRVITIVIPTFNEVDNIKMDYERVKAVFDEKLKKYDWQILFVDNFSIDGTRTIISALCEQDKRVQAIFNGKNYGYTRSSFYGLISAKGDAAVLLYADLQDPPEVIPQLVDLWENGHMVVCGQKRSNKEPIIVEITRRAYYKLLDKISENGHISQYNGFGLYDAAFLQILASIKDPMPYLRGMVAELAPDIGIVAYDHEVREKGKSKFGFYKLLNYSLLGITSTSKTAMRLASLIGVLMVIVCFIVALVTFIMKLTHWSSFPVGTAAIIIGIFFIGAVQLIFIGILGEYVTTMNTRMMNRPLVIEEKRINC